MSPSPDSVQFGNIPPASIRVEPIMHVGKLLQDLGASPEAVFSAAGVSPELFASPEHRVTFAQIQSLLRHAVTATGCDHFGLLLGLTALQNPLGLLGDLTMHCSNVGTAVAYFQQYFHLHDRIGIATRVVDGKDAAIGYLLFHGASEEADQIHDGAIAIGMGLMRLWVGPHWMPRDVTLSRRRPPSVIPYREVFGIVPTFESEYPALHFSSSDFQRPIAGADPVRFALLSETLGTVANKSDLRFSEQVSRAMRGLIALRRCSADEVAAAFSMSRRHMNRKLQDEGTNYRRIHQDAQRALVERMLLRTDKSLVDISTMLDYSDATALSRAFRGWHGCSPSDWRKHHALAT